MVPPANKGAHGEGASGVTLHWNSHQNKKVKVDLHPHTPETRLPQKTKTAVLGQQ